MGTMVPVRIGTPVPTKNTLLKNIYLKKTKSTTPLTPQGGNGDGRSPVSYEQQLEKTAHSLVDYFKESFRKNFDLPCTVLRKGKKDLNEFIDLSRELHPNDIRICIDEFIADDDWTLDGKKTIAMFRARINTYMQPKEDEDY